MHLAPNGPVPGDTRTVRITNIAELTTTGTAGATGPMRGTGYARTEITDITPPRETAVTTAADTTEGTAVPITDNETRHMERLCGRNQM